MGRVTRIVAIEENGERKLLIYIDGKFCVKMRERVAEALNVRIGDVRDCGDLRRKEKYIWKLIYYPKWKEEKERIRRTKELIMSWKLPVTIEETGFGVKSTGIIFSHPEEMGKADLRLVHRELRVPLISLEVTGTNYPRGDDLWLRKDKIEYARTHPEEDYWAAIHLKRDVFFVKPVLTKEYAHREIPIRKRLMDEGQVRIREYYVVFKKDDPEVHSAEEFRRYLREKVLALELSARKRSGRDGCYGARAGI